MNRIFKKIPLFLLTLGLAGCSTFRTFTTESQPPEQEIIVDGKTDDWRGHLFIVEGEGVALGFLNDRQNLYVCLLAENASLRNRIMRQGLTVWFDPQGGKTKSFGIKFPLGLTPGERPMVKPGEERPESENPSRGSLTELEIIRSDKEMPQKMNVEDAKGIEVKAVPSTGFFVYELKIPLVQWEQRPIAVGAEPGKTIGIGFETGKFDSSQMPEGRSGGTRGGGGGAPMGGGRGGRGGMGGRGGYDRGQQLSEAMKIWATVKLAQGQGS